MQYFLALDAGGTKTIGAIGDGERELARAETGTIKLLRTSPENALRNLETLLTQLSRSAKIDLQSITRTCVGLSGIRAPLVADWIRTALPPLAAGELLLCGDEEIALDAAFHGGPGILVVAGTGSNAVGRGSNGQVVRAGGWGPALGDEGSGHWIGQKALRSALRAQNEGRPSCVPQAAAKHWGLSGLEALIERANAAPAPDFSDLAPVVVACAQAGDAVALETIRRAGEELARLATLVARGLERPVDAPPLRIAFAGSVLSPNGPVRGAMIETLRHSASQLEIVEAPVDPVAGALWRARNGVARA